MLFNPSVTETFGNVTLEAMACGLPVVAARATGSASIVKHGQTGYLVAPGAISLFAADLEHYCRDADLRAAHGAAAGQDSGASPWDRSEEHTSELQSLMRNYYAVFCLTKKQH